MSIICTRCGGTQVVCEATINPNTKVITEISDDSLQFGRCETCKVRSVLTDVEKTRADLPDLSRQTAGIPIMQAVG